MKKNLGLDELPEEIQLIMCSLFRAAIFNKRKGMTEERFLELCKGIWETLSLNDLDYLEQTLHEYSLIKLQQHYSHM